MEPELTMLQHQQWLIEQIFWQGRQGNGHKGLRVYNNNLLMGATRALSISYSTIEAMIGREALLSLAKLMLQDHPPETGDWADWGAELPELIKTTSLHVAYPFLADMAMLEWKIHQVQRTGDTHMDIQSMDLLQSVDLENVYLHLHDSVDWQPSDFPLEVLWQWHQKNSALGSDKSRLQEALQQYETRAAVLVYRNKGSVKLLPIAERDLRCYESIRLGCSVAELMDIWPGHDFVDWFSHAAGLGLLHRVTYAPYTSN